MNRKKKTKNVTSIAIKLNSLQVRDLFFKFLIIDVILLSILIGLWCIDAEKNFYGELVQNAQRSINFYPIETSNYTVIWDNGKIMIKDASAFLYNLRRIGIVIGIIELIFLLEEIIFGTAKVRKTLKPLNEIAETAERLSNMVFDEEKFHTLEDAISKISPVASNERIHIQDNEFKGLEDAINKLLDRMRDSYRQQARFVSDASHELRTPISVIQGYANMLDRWGKSDESVLDESIAAIKSESENMILRIGKNDKNEVYFSVQDNGIGMDAEDVPHIFERFFRADTARVRKNGGTGLGLSIAKWIIDNHKGYFSVLSRKGIGTRITVYLPEN